MEGATSMKNLFKISLLTLCVLFLCTTVTHTKTDVDLLNIAEPSRVQPHSINDLTYLLLVWTGKSVIPSYFPQLEFEAGNSLRVTGVSSELGELSGIWTEIEFGDLFSYFTAQVEAEDTSTTTSIPPIESSNQIVNSKISQPTTTFLINLWGISFTFAFEIPPPFEDIKFGVSMLIGAGAYLGTNVVVTGFSGTPIGGDPEFGSVSPNEGEQGQTLDVTVTGRNTTFESASEIVVDFGEGIDVGSPGVRNDTELNVEISILNEAKVGDRTVSVTYDSTVISEAAAFTVTEKIE
jgi:hypothetical protein